MYHISTPDRVFSPKTRRSGASILYLMQELKTASLKIEEERVAWEGLASSCHPPIRRLGAFLLIGFAVSMIASTTTALLYNLFGSRIVEGEMVAVPYEAFYATLALGAVVALGGYFIWLVRSLRSYSAFSQILRRGGRNPRRPTENGLQVYSDEQLLALRSRYEKTRDEKLRARFERTFGFHKDDSFDLGPLSVRPGTFEMNALRVDWESNLILRESEPMPEISWRDEGRIGFLPRQADETRKLIYALHYTGDSVRELKRRYGYRVDRWHKTVPEGKLFDALHDYDEARYIRATLDSRRRG